MDMQTIRERDLEFIGARYGHEMAERVRQRMAEAGADSELDAFAALHHLQCEKDEEKYPAAADIGDMCTNSD